MFENKLTESEFEILELFRDASLSQDDNVYKMIFSDYERSESLFSLMDKDYLSGDWFEAKKGDTFYLKITQKGEGYYRDNKKIIPKEKLTELELELLGYINHYRGEPLKIYDHFLHHKTDDTSWKSLEKLAEKELIKSEWRGSQLYYVLTAKAKDYLWLDKHSTDCN